LQILFWHFKPPLLPHLHGVVEQSSFGKAVSGHTSYKKDSMNKNRFIFRLITTSSQSIVPISIIVASFNIKELIIKFYYTQNSNYYAHILSLHNNPKFLPHWQGDKAQEELKVATIGHDSS
jgi:hypothetical protein